MKILLTRPIDDSIITSKTLSKIGIETVIIPFLEINGFDYQEFEISKTDYLMFTSKNAVNFFRFEKKFRNNVVFSVGSETKMILQKKGFQNIINADDNLEKLLILTKKKLKKGDVIIQVNRIKISSTNELYKLNEEAKKAKKTSLLMLILRNGMRRFIGLPTQ